MELDKNRFATVVVANKKQPVVNSKQKQKPQTV